MTGVLILPTSKLKLYNLTHRCGDVCGQAISIFLKVYYQMPVYTRINGALLLLGSIEINVKHLPISLNQ